MYSGGCQRGESRGREEEVEGACTVDGFFGGAVGAPAFLSALGVGGGGVGDGAAALALLLHWCSKGVGGWEAELRRHGWCGGVDCRWGGEVDRRRRSGVEVFVSGACSETGTGVSLADALSAFASRIS